MEQYEAEYKKLLNRAGFSLVLMAVAVLGSQNLINAVIYRINPKLCEASSYSFILTAISVIGFGLPVIYAVLRKLPDMEHGEVNKLKFSQFIAYFFVCAAFMYMGNYVGGIVNAFIRVLKGSDIINPIEEVIVNGSLLMNILYASIVGPIVEELIFRKILLNKLRRLGDAPAILLSGFAFGLFHMNLSQFFYASVLGIIFAYIAIRTNTIRYTILLHIMINSLGAVLAPFALKWAVTLQYLLVVWVIACITIGVIIFSRNIKHITLEKAVYPIRNKSVYLLNPGTIVYLLLCIAAMVFVILR